MFSKWRQEAGEGLIEVMIVLFIATIVIGAMTIATVRGISNAQFSQNQTQATKLAQDALERIRTIRDRNLPIILTTRGSIKFSEFQQDVNACVSGCYFRLDTTNLSIIQVNSTDFDALEGGLQRQIILKTSGVATNREINANVLIKWVDAGGSHQSDLQTIYGEIK